jgi:hypothetical protein
MLRRVLLATLVCVAVWAWGPGPETHVAAVSTSHLAHPRSFDGHSSEPARSTDVWQSAGAVVAVHTWRLDGPDADLPAAAPHRASHSSRTTSPALRRSPPSPPHTFDLPLLI